MHRRALLWGMLVALLVAVQSLLVWLSYNYESTRAQDQVETISSRAAAEIRQTLLRSVENLQALAWSDPPPEQWHSEVASLLQDHHEIVRIERRDTQFRIVEAVDSPQRPPVFRQLPRQNIEFETELACRAAERRISPVYSSTYFVPEPDGLGLEVIDLCVPVMAHDAKPNGSVTATFQLGALLSDAVTPELARSHELRFVEGDGTRLAHAGLVRGSGVYVSEQTIDLPGATLRLHVDSAARRPLLIPNLTIALVLGLSLALAAVVLMLTFDVRRRTGAERALAEALAFRKAMEDSLVTGLRALDLQGVVTYVNPAFCEMVGFTAAQIVGQGTPPYWPEDLAAEYRRRQRLRMDEQQLRADALETSREGFESTFERNSGERFPVLIYEAPLVDGAGRQAGWMSTVLDVSDQRRSEELSRQQQERLQAAARLAAVGEMASLLSHELNQPLSAIASYATGTLNLMAEPIDGATTQLLKHATERIAEQAERAGRVIQSVHNLVRRRDGAHESIRCDALIDAVLPLVRLQARKSEIRVEVDLPKPVPRVACDRTMVEQVLLNLSRNGIQAMEDDTPTAHRQLCIQVRQHVPRWVTFSVIDHGPGIPPAVAQRLFSPFFTTRSEGMGLGLNLCRSFVEQHGGALDFDRAPAADGSGVVTEFRFTLPADKPSASTHVAAVHAETAVTPP